jgi:hypothetical protein
MRSVRAADVLPLAMFSMYLPNETNVMSMVDVSKKTWGWWSGLDENWAKNMDRTE